MGAKWWETESDDKEGFLFPHKKCLIEKHRIADLLTCCSVGVIIWFDLPNERHAFNRPARCGENTKTSLWLTTQFNHLLNGSLCGESTKISVSLFSLIPCGQAVVHPDAHWWCRKQLYCTKLAVNQQFNLLLCAFIKIPFSICIALAFLPGIEIVYMVSRPTAIHICNIILHTS